jgi:hypothetical protein
MMKEFKELLMKKAKEGKNSDPDRLKAGSEVLKELGDMFKDRIKGNLKKVTVASDSPEGLKKGLEKAEEMLEAPHDSKMESDVEDVMEPELKKRLSEEDEDSEEELEDSDDEIAELEKKIAELKAKKGK